MPIYNCDICNIQTKIRSHYKRHLNTIKHKNKQLEFNKSNNITPLSIKKNIEEILETTTEQDHVTIELDETKQLVGKDFDKHIKILDKKMKDYAIKLEFEEAAQLRDEINRLKAKQLGVPNKILQFNR